MILCSAPENDSAGSDRHPRDRDLSAMPGVPAVNDYTPLGNVGVLLSTCTTPGGLTRRWAWKRPLWPSH